MFPKKCLHYCSFNCVCVGAFVFQLYLRAKHKAFVILMHFKIMPPPHTTHTCTHKITKLSKTKLQNAKLPKTKIWESREHWGQKNQREKFQKRQLKALESCWLFLGAQQTIQMQKSCGIHCARGYWVVIDLPLPPLEAWKFGRKVLGKAPATLGSMLQFSGHAGAQNFNFANI